MQYVPFASDIEIPFYTSLASHKINYDKLDDSAREVVGLYEIRPGDAKEHSCRMQIRGNALTVDHVPAGTYRAEGMIKNVNTIEDYRNIDKIAMLQQAGRTIWDAIHDGTIYDCPSLLASFLILSFADLKKYRYQYWFAFPALVMDPPWAPISHEGADYRTLTSAESTALVDVVQTWKYSTDHRQHGFFLVKKNRRIKSSKSPPEDSETPDEPATPQSPATPSVTLGYTWQVASLSSYDTGFFEGEYSDDCYIAFADPSNYTQQSGPVAPGWMLRNLLVLVRQKWKRERVQILCYRETQPRRDAARSIIYDLQVSSQRKKPSSNATGADPGTDDPLALPKVVGWERNAQGKLAGRLADLNEYMDPTKLADTSVDLNLKLIKWRISPNLNLDKIKETRCLLLGAGTLGSYVSRNLMGWGVRKITFVDNAGVSFSNPVRQPLYNFNDCLEGGKRKAIRAAEALKEIYPGVDSSGHVMSVPMAGHPITDVERTKAEFEKLRDLVDEHDAIFLLMDSRESRWLPTVMGKATGKIVMNAALGFDTYVVMRHGVKNPSIKFSDAAPALSSESSAPGTDTDQHTVPQQPSTKSPTVSQTQPPPPSLSSEPYLELGCYFCNDVVAPADSMKDLTLDQQCTVTRPGVAAIASALLVETLVSVLQHPLGAAAPASTSPDSRGDHPLGIIPHQIRGFLSTFSNINVVGRSYDCCSACSDRVVNAYREHGWEFVRRAMDEQGFVEELSGLKEVQRLAEEAAKEMEFDDEDDGFEEEDGDGEMI